MRIGLATRLSSPGAVASLQPTVTLDLLQAALDGRLSFSRASGATDIIDGALTAFSADAPRISASGGLLLEESRTNSAFGSTLNNGGDMTITTGQSDPLGGTAAYLCTEGTASATHMVTSNSVPYLTGTSYTLSAFVKAGTCDRVQLRTAGFVSGNAYANFYLSGAGSVTAGSYVAARIVALNGGWYRISVSFNGSNGSDSIKIYPVITGSEGGNPTTTGTSRTFYVYGCQQEAGPFPTSYIPTTTTAATRAVESCSMALGGLFNAAEGTLWVEARSGTGFDAGAATSPRLVRLDDGTSGNLHEIRRTPADGILRASTVTASAEQSLIAGAVLGADTLVRAAYAYKAGDLAFCQGAGTVGTDSDTPDGLPAAATLRLGAAGTSSGLWGGYLRQVKYWNRRLSNSQLQGITT